MPVQWFSTEVDTKDLPWSTEFANTNPDFLKEEFNVTKVQLCNKGIILETEFFKGFFFKSSLTFKHVTEYCEHYAVTKQDHKKKAPTLKVELQPVDTNKPNSTNLKVGIDTDSFVRIKLNPDDGKNGAYELMDYEEFLEQYNRKGSFKPSNPLISTDPLPTVETTSTASNNSKGKGGTGNAGSGKG